MEDHQVGLAGLRAAAGGVGDDVLARADLVLRRDTSSVGPGAVRDFRGAMMGRGDKGLIITTGTFTADAKAEAARDGAPPLDLIDGTGLCDLLKEFDMGVTTRIRQVEDVSVDASFFEGI
ncbi:hypothetical protein A5719_01865 [Mycolicibacterium peregrinum]|nr:hypothetical protein A5719_01865 [Mycolicibacterium peregrinum]